MKRNISNSILFLFLLSLTMACKTKKKVVVVAPPATDSVVVNKDKPETLKLLQEKDVDYTTLTLRGKAKIDFNGNVNNVSINMRIKKDEGIWVSITALMGIEAARALITPDSIKVINRIENTYLQQPFSYVHRYTNKQVDFKLLQSILSGNTIKAFMNNDATLDFQNGVWELQGQQAALAYRVLFNTLMKVSEHNLNDLNSGQALKVVYGDYQNMNGTLFPSAISINSMAGKKKISLDLDFSKVESNLPVEFPFNVPGKYEVIH